MVKSFEYMDGGEEGAVEDDLFVDEPINVSDEEDSIASDDNRGLLQCRKQGIDL